MNYLALLGAHYEFDEASGGLIESLGLTPNWVEQNGPHLPTDGVIEGPSSSDGARAMPAANDGFSRAVGIGDTFDYTSQSKPLMTWNLWVRSNQSALDSLVGEQVGIPEAEKSHFLRNVHNLGGGNQAGLVGFRDNAGADYDWAFAFPAAGFGVGNYPIGEWCMIGFSANINEDRTSGWFYTQSQGQHFVSFTGASAFGAPFNYTTRGVTWLGANASGGSTTGAGPRGDEDQFDVYPSYEFLKKDVDRFWNGGRGRRFPSGYFIGEGGGVPPRQLLKIGGRQHRQRWR